jgi:hypothetical protein
MRNIDPAMAMSVSSPCAGCE